jgi:Peptidase family M23
MPTLENTPSNTIIPSPSLTNTNIYPPMNLPWSAGIMHCLFINEDIDPHELGFNLNFEPVLAVLDGEVIEAGWDMTGYGNVIKIQHQDNTVAIYSHLNQIDVERNELIAKGQTMGISGATGMVRGPFLGFTLLDHPDGNSITAIFAEVGHELSPYECVTSENNPVVVTPSQINENKIWGFKYLGSFEPNRITFSVNYSYTGDHGEDVYIGASLLNKGEHICSACSPINIKIGVDTANIQVGPISGCGEKESNITDQIEIMMYEGGKQPFYSVVIDYPIEWK